jgi:hypothetical protein
MEAQLTALIKTQVEATLAEVMDAKSTLDLMSEELENRVLEIVNEAIGTHELENEHHNEDYITGCIDNYMRHSDYIDRDDLDNKISEAMLDGDYPNEERVEEMLSSYIEESDLEDKMREVMDEIKAEGGQLTGAQVEDMMISYVRLEELDAKVRDVMEEVLSEVRVTAQLTMKGEEA